jgi:Flp pilus assembly protein TadG
MTWQTVKQRPYLGVWSKLVRGVKRAQAAVEFALIAPVVFVTMLVGVQFAIIGAAALGLAEVAYQGARYAAVNTSYTQDQVKTYMLSVASPIISTSNGTYLTATMTGSPTCAFGSTVRINVSFNINHLVVLPNPFMGIVSFPSQLTNAQSAFCE